MNDNLKENTSKRIKELRLEHKMTMESLAEKIGVSKSTIAKWENGYVENMRQDNIMKLSMIFNVSAVYIMGYDAPKDEPKEVPVEELTDKERHFIDLYSQLKDSEKDVVDKLLQSLVNDK